MIIKKKDRRRTNKTIREGPPVNNLPRTTPHLSTLTFVVRTISAILLLLKSSRIRIQGPGLGSSSIASATVI